MITINSISMKNFLSIGQNTQTVVLDDTPLTLILGENLDQGSNGSRNGVGKTALVQAICFAIYGLPLTNIKRDNLVNKINQKGMEVSLSLTVDNKKYKIERGRKPNFLRYYVNDNVVNAPDTDEAHGESKWTQREIEKVFGMSREMFKHLVALHTKTTPFLSLPDKAQRDIIEELISITQLSEKADQLKELNKAVRDEIRDEEIRIKTLIEGNERVQKTINDLNFKSKIWDREHEKKLNRIAEEILTLEEVDIDLELTNHSIITEWDKINTDLSILDREYKNSKKNFDNICNLLEKEITKLASVKNQTCPMCEQNLTTGKHTHISDVIELEIKRLETDKEKIEPELIELQTALTSLTDVLSELGNRPVLVYKDLNQVYEHKNMLSTLRSDLERESNVENPYLDQIANLSTSAMQEISYDYINELTTIKEHQDFLIKLLTSKDSFIRKKIIDQNLNYLNFRLGHYLGKLQLPYDAEFKSDMSVEITQYGRDFDFDQLSNGEANRLILSLAWAFRDVWESMNHKLNILIIDELVDSGMDSSGTDSALEILREMSRTNNKNIFLISHKDGLETRVDKIALVQKENNFTKYVMASE